MGNHCFFRRLCQVQIYKIYNVPIFLAREIRFREDTRISYGVDERKRGIVGNALVRELRVIPVEQGRVPFDIYDVFYAITASRNNYWAISRP